MRKPSTEKCKVDGCGDFLAVRKHSLCMKHYYRWRDTGRTEILSTTKRCEECNSSMSLLGFATKTQKYCSNKCHGASKRRREIKTRGYSGGSPSYKYEWKLKNNYGITIDQYREMHEAQNGLCAICSRSENEIGEKLCVDHDHASGDVRGLLCRKCNKAIGGFEESIETIENALAYLKRPPSIARAIREQIWDSGDRDLEVV